MIRHLTRLFSARNAFLLVALFALLAGAAAWLSAGHGPVDHAVAAPAGPESAGEVQGIHVRRAGDNPGLRDTMKMMVDAQRAQCGSELMKQTCRITLSDPAATPRARSRCAEMMSGFRLSGDPGSVGQTVVDEYFAPPLHRSVRVLKTTLLRQTGMCSAVVEQQEKRVITHDRPGGYTRHERKTDQSGQPYWVRFDHQYLPGLADMLKTSFDAALFRGKVTVTAPLGHKTLVPGRPCETRRIDAGAAAFVSCIHATGLAFPSHITFESEVLAGGKTERFEKLVSYAPDVALSRDLFFPAPGEKTLTEKAARSDPSHPMNRWCAAEKARTGVDPCKDDDE